MTPIDPAAAALNAICPYFTMFPLAFPLSVLSRHARHGDNVLDPFCGRGTTNYAARLLGLPSIGVDASPVAAAITAAKLVNATPKAIVAEARSILASQPYVPVPVEPFWEVAFHRDVLDDLCRFRAAFLHDCDTPSRMALRGVILGALHGPRQQTFPSYFSNQCPRTYAPKPGYALRYWTRSGLRPERVDMVGVIARRAERYFSCSPTGKGYARLADSRNPDALRPRTSRQGFRWIITSPPYYGMRTYVADQWLRHWFLGGPATVDYRHGEQIVHTSPDAFTDDLRKVWRNAADGCETGARLVIRFGGIADRSVNPLDIVKASLRDSGWRLETLRAAGDANSGKRQAETFMRTAARALTEHDVWARLQ
jgi:hypothetical protein